MTDPEFLALYKATLASIEETVEAAIQEDDADMDYEAGDDMLTLSFRNGSVAIISRQTAIRQLWLAARSGGFHFDYDEQSKRWICTIDGRHLGAMLQEVCLEQGGVRLAFDP